MSAIVLTNARLIDGTGSPTGDQATIVIDNGHISSVQAGAAPSDTAGADAQPIDLEGRTLLPGLINAHIHILMDAGPDPLMSLSRSDPATAVLHGARRGERILRAGITTARDLGGFEFAELALRAAFARGEFPGPRLLCAGKV